MMLGRARERDDTRERGDTEATDTDLRKHTRSHTTTHEITHEITRDHARSHLVLAEGGVRRLDVPGEKE